MDDALEQILGITPRPPPAATRSLGGGHRITAAAWTTLSDCHGETQLPAILTNELQHLAPIAHVAYQQHHLLVTDYYFKAKSNEQTLCYWPNPEGGITIGLPGERYE